MKKILLFLLFRFLVFIPIVSGQTQVNGTQIKKSVFLIADSSKALANDTAAFRTWINTFISGGGSGTVTSFSSGNASGLFSTNVANPTTTPALSFSLAGANGNLVFATPNGSSGQGSYRALVSGDIPSLNYQSPITTGTTAQYFRGDLSLATFPTALSSFTNDVPFATASNSIAFTNKTGNISQWTNNSGYISLSGISATSPLSYNNGTGVFTTSMATGKLIGRSTASTGVMEEITVGSGISLIAGVLSATGGGSVTGSGATDQVAYWSSSSALTGTTDFVFDGSHLGVGTSMPAYAVDVVGNLNVTTSAGSGTFPSMGGTVTFSGGYTIHTFATSGTFTSGGGQNIEVLVVAGGGGGGGSQYAGGGGAGGMVEHSALAVTGMSYTVTVGAGGPGGTAGNSGSSGSNSVFNGTTALGGGGGAIYPLDFAGGSGGSGGGGSSNAGAAGTATQGNSGGGTGYGNNGGAGTGNGGGGGGGATTAGTNGINGNAAGGTGRSNSISGSAVIYAAGGTGSAASGGGASGTANRGNGGGGAGATSTGGNGGSGVVIIRYLTPPTTTLHTDLDGRVAVGSIFPTAYLHLPAGQSTAEFSPLKFTSGTVNTTAEAGAIEFDGTDFYATPSSTRNKIARVLTGTATLDFGNLVTIGCSDLTITVTGAALGDAVSIGVPNGSVPSATTTFSGWVSSSNTVTVRCCALVSGDPASGVFEAVVIKN